MLPLSSESARVDLGGHLLPLLSDITAAVHDGRLVAALRLADRAARVAPQDPTVRLLHARLLLRNGCAAEAENFLQDARDPEALATRADALCQLGRMEQAAGLCSELLRHYAVDCASYLPPLAARLCTATEKSCHGWVGLDSGLRLVGEVRPDCAVSVIFGAEPLHPVFFPTSAHGLVPFLLELPHRWSNTVRALAGSDALLGSGLAWPPAFGPSGWVLLQEGMLYGKANLDWAPSLPATVVIQADDDEPSIVTSPRTRFPEPTFSLDTRHWRSSAGKLQVSVRLPDGRDFPLAGSPIVLRPPVTGQTRTLELARGRITPQEDSRKVDVIIPVYAGYEETLRCLECVLATLSAQEAEIVVIDDASPDSELRAALAAHAQRGRITLLSNPENVGFPGAVNRGMRLHCERDVVLLNSDTEVFGAWLERLKRVAYASEDTGTVTPLGDSASITSYPMGVESPPSREQAEAIDRLTSQINANAAVEIPVGVGFCLYIRRACLAETGYFDEGSFARGYGEENDFCLRAKRYGWRHMAAADVYVRHQGARSFGPMRQALRERNRRVLNARYPGYDEVVAEFHVRDPLHEARRAIDARRLLDGARDPVLILTLALPGGVERHVELRRAALESSGHTVVILQPADFEDHCTRLSVRVPALDLRDLTYDLPRELDTLRNLLAGLPFSDIEVHHFLGMHPEVLRLVTSLGADYDIFLHDYAWVCPRVTLLSGNHRYCGEPELEACEACVRNHGSAVSGLSSVRELRERSAVVLRGARRVHAPSHDVATRIGRYFPGQAIEVVPWENISWGSRSTPAPEGERIRVIVLGAISHQKGYHVLLECARNAAERDLSLEFVVIGYTRDDAALMATGRVFITGPYIEREVGALLARERGHAAFVPSVTPETWCYTLSYILRAGMPAVAFDCGAQAERLRGFPFGVLLPLGTPVPTINDELMRLAYG
jgi:GT2 family glycosyltransferase/glycosyltransferase involved in cell wall biosynthesis